MKEKILLQLKKHRIDIIWILVIMILTFGIRFSPVFLKDYSKSYDTLYADASYRPYTNDPGDSFYYARRIQDFADGKEAMNPLSNVRDDEKHLPVNEERDASWTRNLFPIIGAFLSKICNLFGITDPLLIGTLYVSLLVFLAASLLFVFIKNRTNRFGGVVAAISLSCGTPVLLTTNWGHCDTDGLLILLPIAMMLAFFKSLEAEERKNQIIWSVVTCIIYVMMCLTWSSYNVYYLIIVASAGATLIGSLLFKGVFPKKIKLTILIQIIFQTLFSFLIDGKQFLNGIINLFIASSSGVGKSAEGYPSAAQYVGELMKLSWVSTGIEQWFDTTAVSNINMMGGVATVLLVLFTATVLIIMCFRNRATQEERFRTIGLQTTIFLPWLVATAFMLLQGRRFLENLLLPICILFGLGLGYLVNYIREKEISLAASMFLYAACLIVSIGTFMSSGFILGILSFIVVIFCMIVFRNKYKKLLIFLLTGALIVTPLNGAYKVSDSYVPGITGIYYDTADWIKKNTAEDALVASWWDYGYFYQCYADRATIGHGGVFYGPYYYWLGRGLLTSDYKLSAGIFRMLGNSGLTAQDVLAEVVEEPKKQCEMLADILPVSGEEALHRLVEVYKIPEKTAREVVKRTHPSKGKPIYLTITQDMFAKSFAIAYYGNWKFGEKTENYYFSTSEASRHVEKGEQAIVRVVGNGANIVRAAYVVGKDGKMVPHAWNENNQEVSFGRYVMIENDKIVVDQKNNEHKDTMIVFKEGNYYSAVFCNSDFCDSVMFRLFFTDASEQDVYSKVFSTEVSKEIFGDHSMIQHKIFCPGLKSYLGSAGVYRIN